MRNLTTAKRNHSSKCCCSWDECSQWSHILSESDKEDALVTLSGDGNRLFVNDELHHVRIQQWKETDTTTTATSWTYAGQTSADNIGNEAINLTVSMSGDRVTVGHEGSVSVYECQFDELMKAWAH